MSRRLALAAVFLLALTAAGCTRDGPSAQSAPPSAATQPAPTVAPSESPRGRAGVDDCDAAVLARIDERIDAQLAAFRAGDFTQALTHASRGFRSRFTPEAFQRVIEQGFPQVRRANGHTSAQCVTDGRRASVLVEVTGDAEPVQLVYEMVLEDGDWRIGGAARHGGPNPADSEPETTVQRQARRRAT